MWPPFDYFEHRRICKLKQDERTRRIANCPPEYDGPLSQTDRSILSKPISELVKEVHAESTSPRSILAAYGKAALKVHRRTNCITEVMLADAGEWADKEINKKGPLAGIPISLKDSVACKGYDVSVGYSRHCFKPYAEDGAMVRLFKDAGAIPYVKTALPISLLSFESANDVWGRCTNPHNADYSPGGSTGGEGALLAGGGGRIGIGSDVAGSVRAPAHFSGCYSLRCSTGRWPRMGNNTSMPGQEGVLAVFSPMARELGDLVHLSRSIVGMQPWKYDHSCHPMEWSDHAMRQVADAKVLRVGVMRTDGVVDPSPACARALEQTVAALRAEGHEIKEIVNPPSPYEALVIASQLLNSDGCDTFSGYFRTGEWNDAGAAVMRGYMRLPRWLKYLHYLWTRYVRGDVVWAGLLRHWYPKTATQQWQWVARREAYRARWHAWWEAEQPDFILCPPNATPAVPHGGMGSAVSSCGYTFIWNLLDYSAGVLPVTRVDAAADALPAGFSLRALNGVARGAYALYDAAKMAGLPVGVQVVGRRLEEERTLAHMQRVEDALQKHGGKYELLNID